MSEPRFFEAPDAYEEPTLWEHDPARPDYPQIVMQKCDLKPPFRDGLWRCIVEAVTSA